MILSKEFGNEAFFADSFGVCLAGCYFFRWDGSEREEAVLAL